MPGTQSRSESTTPPAHAGGLATYLAVGVTGSILVNAQTEAGVVMIDLTNVQGNNITGTNGGVVPGGELTIDDWLGAGTGRIEIYNQFTYGYTGLDGDDGLNFAVNGSGDASPRNFASNETIDSSATWTGSAARTVFEYGDASAVSADFGAGSFIAFRFGTSGNYNYGYLEVTWDSSNTTFQILSGAYESDVNTAILAGATGGAPVPGPAVSAMALMALGGGAFRRRSRGGNA